MKTKKIFMVIDYINALSNQHVGVPDMHFSVRKLTMVSVWIAIFAAVIFLGYVVHQEAAIPSSKVYLSGLKFSGTCETSTGSFPFSNEMGPSASEFGSVTLRGHFDKDVTEGQNLLLRIQNMRVKIYCNDKLIYTYGQPGSYPWFSKSPGNTWEIFACPQIKAADVLQIELESVYPNNISSAYQDFISQVLVGDSGELLHFLLRQMGFTVFLGGAVFLLGCLLVLVALLLRILRTSVPPQVIRFALFAIVSGLWFFFDFQIISLIIPMGVFSNIISMICLCLMAPLLGYYVLHFIDGKAKIPLQALICIQLGFTLFYIAVQAMGIFDGYELLSPLVLLMVMGIVCMLGALLHQLLFLRNKITHFLMWSCSVFLLTVVDMVEYFVTFSPQYTFTKVSYCLFIMIHFLFAIHCIRQSINGLRRTHQLESELAQNRIAIALSQIQPHFLYNALTAIKQLCAVDPGRAEQAVGDFSNFLRGNLDSLSSEFPIPFERELNHTKNYLALEQLRFGKRLRITYDLQATGFMLPSLTVQPLVENAVRYGVSKKAAGGTISIATMEDSGEVQIVVSDDGVGFDVNVKPTDGRSHIGLENVRNRLLAQCGGTLTVDSSPGKGTVVTICIQKGKADMLVSGGRL